MKIVELFTQILLFVEACRSWEYCQRDIQKALCGTQTHFACDSEKFISKPIKKSIKFLCHVPLTRKIKTSFINWHNYYRNHTAGGNAKNKENVNFPRAVRMRELIWDSELSFLSHLRTKFIFEDEITCGSTQRFPLVTQNLILVKAVNDTQPVLAVIASSLEKMFNTKKFVQDPKKLPKKFLKDHKKANQFIIMVNDRVSRLGCAVALATGCKQEDTIYKYCYYTACTYDADNEGVVYKMGKPTGRCSFWKVGKSKTYTNLCANSEEIFKSDSS